MPFCPKCRDEFQDWVTTCPDCHVILVSNLQPLPKPLQKKLVTVATFRSSIEAELYRARLEAEGIQATVLDIQANAFAGLGVRLQVLERDLSRATELIMARDERN